MQRSFIEGREDPGVESGRGRVGQSVVLPVDPQFCLKFPSPWVRDSRPILPFWVAPAARAWRAFMGD